jgi:hypothetical protein
VMTAVLDRPPTRVNRPAAPVKTPAVPLIGRAGTRRRRMTAPRYGVALLILMVLAADLWVLTNYNRATPIRFEDAVGRYREHAVGVSTPTAQLPDASTGDAASGASADSPVSAPVGAVTPPAALDPSAPPNGPARPAPGVYAFTTTGTEQLGATQRSYPSTTYAIVELGDGCEWSFDHQVLREHTDRYTGCNTATSSLTGWVMHREFLGLSVDKDYACTGGALVDGARAPGSGISIECQVAGDDEHISMRLQDLGPAEVVIGGQSVAAAHVSGTAEMTGYATGTATLELWLDPVSGLRLREIRSVDAQVDEKVTTNRYTEQAEFVLQSLTPQQ